MHAWTQGKNKGLTGGRGRSQVEGKRSGISKI